MSGAPVFDRRLLRQRRDRAAAHIVNFDFLLEEVAERLMERLDMVRRTFPVMADIGCRHGVLTRRLRARVGTEIAAALDLSPALAAVTGGMALAADEEALPFAAHSLDAAVSNLSLHWTNDLPGVLIQIVRALKPDGFFLASLLGAESLHELRHALMEAEILVTGGASPRVSPFPRLHDLAALLQRAGLALPVADSDTITVDYPDLFALMRDLRGMGGANALISRPKHPARQQIFIEAARIYREKFNSTTTFQVLYATGWAPHESQPQPLKPGSARERLADALGSPETKI